MHLGEDFAGQRLGYLEHIAGSASRFDALGLSFCERGNVTPGGVLLNQYGDPQPT